MTTKNNDKEKIWDNNAPCPDEWNCPLAESCIINKDDCDYILSKRSKWVKKYGHTD